MLDKALLSQMLGGLWSEAKTQTSKTEKALPVEEKKPSFSLTRQTLEPERKARQILREAVNNPDLLYDIKERASIRWSNGLSDSLFNAVLCNLKPLNEEAERDSNGEIILKPKTDWHAEISTYR